MKIELKSLRINNRLSEETTCFTASLYIDGKKVAKVLNRGCGGDTEFVWDGPNPYNGGEVAKKLHAYCESLPPSGTLAMDADLYVSLLVEKTERQKLCKKQTLFRTKTDPAGSWRVVKEPFRPELKAWIEKKYGDELAEILNETVTA